MIKFTYDRPITKSLLGYSFDATLAVNRMGRYANDAPASVANCSARFKVFKDVGPIAALFATRDITVGEELLIRTLGTLLGKSCTQALSVYPDIMMYRPWSWESCQVLSVLSSKFLVATEQIYVIYSYSVQ